MDLGEGRDEVHKFAQEQGLTFTILLDGDRSVAHEYQVYAIPSTFFIDAEGVIQLRHGGPLDETLIEESVQQVVP